MLAIGSLVWFVGWILGYNGFCYLTDRKPIQELDIGHFLLGITTALFIWWAYLLATAVKALFFRPVKTHIR